MDSELSCRVSYRFPKSVVDELTAVAREDRRTKTQVMMIALEQLFKNRKKVLTSGTVRVQVPPV